MGSIRFETRKPLIKRLLDGVECPALVGTEHKRIVKEIVV